MPSSDMDIDRPLSREEVLTPNTDDFIIGDRVWVNGTKPGYIQYLGEVQFSPGDWAGVVLDEHSGKNDGSVAGVRYFQCEAKRGVFARLHKLTRYPLVHATTPTKMGSNTPTPPPPIQRCLTPTRTPSPGARALREGDRVQVSSSSGGPPKTGVLRYMGHTDFATGEWAGVELDDPLGKNDGTVAGKRNQDALNCMGLNEEVLRRYRNRFDIFHWFGERLPLHRWFDCQQRYFRCAQNYGLFSPAHKVSRCTSSLGRQGRTRNTVPEREEPSKNIPIQNEKDASYRFSEESERRAQRLRQLLETAEAERRDLVSKLEEERRKVEELEFRIEEECIGKDDLEVERERERHRIEELERRLEQEVRKNEMRDGGATPDTILKEETQALSKEVEHLREKLRQADQQMKDLQHAKQASLPKPSSLPVADELVRKEEALLQAQLTLDNKKREVQNLLDRIAETEKELEKCKARQSRQIDTIDELNMKLQKSESKCSSVQEELHTTRQMIGEMDRRLKTCGERVSHLEKDKLRLEEQLLNPESTPEAEALRERLQERERDCSEWRKEAEAAREEVDRQREERDRIKKELEEKLQNLKEDHQDEWRKERKKYTESAETSSSKIRELERKLTSVRSDFEQNRVEAEARLSRQEARLQEAELKGQNLDRIRDQMSRLQSEKDLLRVEKEEILKRLQVSEEARTRWEGEANRSTAEVEVLKVQVLQLKTEFTTHREDLVKKLAETKFDAQMVQDLHEEIEEQRRLVETMQQRLKSSEEEKEQLKDDLSITQEGREKMESHLRRDLEALKRRLSDSESERASLQRSLEAAQLLAEERAVQQQQSKVAEKNELEKNLVNLQAELASLKNGQTKPDSDQAKLMQDKEALEQQVHFMNSVIVDMQHKNDDLRSRLDILETEVLFDGHTRMSLGSRSPSRAFCDICDTFDIHDTEDCPKQLSVRRTLSYSSQESEF